MADTGVGSQSCTRVATANTGVHSTFSDTRIKSLRSYNVVVEDSIFLKVTGVSAIALQSNKNTYLYVYSIKPYFYSQLSVTVFLS